METSESQEQKHPLRGGAIAAVLVAFVFALSFCGIYFSLGIGGVLLLIGIIVFGGLMIAMKTNRNVALWLIMGAFGVAVAVSFHQYIQQAEANPQWWVLPTARPPADCSETGFEPVDMEVGKVVDNEGPSEIYFFVQDWRVYVPLPTGFDAPAWSSVPGTFAYFWDDRCPPGTIQPYNPEGNLFIKAEWEDVVALGWLVEMPEPAPAQK